MPQHPPDAESLAAARAAGLRHVSDSTPGVRRLRRGRGFAYVDADGARVTDPVELRRIRDIVIPPAWQDVWISPVANGHIQATGRDSRGRKQYRYHERWREVRDDAKYELLVGFAEALPRIRAQVAADMRRSGLPRERVVATVVRLLDSTAVRVGNQEYARENGSFGLTTLRDEHVDVGGATVRFQFPGKGGKEVSVDVADRRVARVIQRCEELPGQELFQYLDDDGARHVVRSDDVNEWLCETAGEDFTAKHFRTWRGTVLAAMALSERADAADERAARQAVVEAVRSVARMLGNTPAVCRRCYIHPDIVDAHLEGELAAALAGTEEDARSDDGESLSAPEAAVLALLRARLAAEERLAS